VERRSASRRDAVHREDDGLRTGDDGRSQRRRRTADGRGLRLRVISGRLISPLNPSFRTRVQMEGASLGFQRQSRFRARVARFQYGCICGTPDPVGHPVVK